MSNHHLRTIVTFFQRRMATIASQSTPMPYLQLSIPCTEDQQPRVERALEAAGALAVTLQDAHLDLSLIHI